ncbi:hypothetical protein DB32_006030 [Sandaracinus amylolyticus]|uniref:Uncharacterized protein n=2 Tax=Sandaracinus amylolyticus TaxID=927083 RepID=A0A0F6W6P0_9BACT|nr:hypothetical protein DB32_006030 [Sandaracinus amylolyticus]
MRAVLAQLGATTRELTEARTRLAKIDADEKAKAEADKITAADRFADELVTSGKIHDVTREHMRALHLENPTRAVALADSLPPAVPTTRVTPLDPKGPKGNPKVAASGNAWASLDAEERTHAEALWGTGLFTDRAVVADKARAAVAKARESA